MQIKSARIWLTPRDLLETCDLVRCPRCRRLFDSIPPSDDFDRAAGQQPCPRCSERLMAVRS